LIRPHFSLYLFSTAGWAIFTLTPTLSLRARESEKTLRSQRSFFNSKLYRFCPGEKAFLAIFLL
jgi:hypothetical protein